MMTLSPVKSIEHAAAYYSQSDHADYYTRDEKCPSAWAGKGAESLGVNGLVVERELFVKYLNGEIGSEKLGTTRAGKQVRKPAVDCVISPPKSVTILALVGGDNRIIDAHNNAINAAIKKMEETAAYFRKHGTDSDGRDKFDHVHTGNLLCAVFQHETSRTLSPQLHSHIVVLNATELSKGQWRSIESRHLYCQQKAIGLHYRQQLASSLKLLGYELERKQDASFEIKGVPEGLINAFSQRRDAIDRELEKQGYTRESAPASVKEKIARRFRNKKSHVDKGIILKKWNDIEEDHEFKSEVLVQQALVKSRKMNFGERLSDESFNRLKEITTQVISDLSERDAVFSVTILESKINGIAVGYGIPCELVRMHVANLEKNKLLLTRQTREYSSQFKNWSEVPAYTTPAIEALETELLDCLLSSKGATKSEFKQGQVETIIKDVSRRSIKEGFSAWNVGQEAAMRGLLMSNDSIVGIQGYAGTAKTSTVLRELSVSFSTKGYEVVGMAPSASACQSLKDGAKLISTATVASHLIKSSFDSRSRTNMKKQLWLVDEASLLSTKDMSKLLHLAEGREAKVVLVGDCKQLGSIEAGAAYRQLIENGLQVYELDEIVRQQNPKALGAVYAALDGEVRKALELLDGVGGNVMETSGDVSRRYEAIIESFITLPKEERNKALIIDPSREGRQQLSLLLRSKLKELGELKITGIETVRLERVDHTKSTKKDALNYKKGDVIKFGKEYRRQEVAKNTYWNVVGIDIKKNVLTLHSESDVQMIWNPAGSWGQACQVFSPQENELCVGDRIIWTHNDKGLGLTNGMKGSIESVDSDSQTVDVKFNNGMSRTLELKKFAQQHWSYDYVTTAHASQGMTADKVFYHAESFRRNLASQKSFYVSISRAKFETVVVTDNRVSLEQQIMEHSGEKQNAIELKQFYPDTDMAINL